MLVPITPGSQANDLGGVMSRNARLEPAGLVLRVHQPFVTRARLVALQTLRRRLTGQGLIVPLPTPWRNQAVFRSGTDAHPVAGLRRMVASPRPPVSLASC